MLMKILGHRFGIGLGFAAYITVAVLATWQPSVVAPEKTVHAQSVKSPRPAARSG